MPPGLVTIHAPGAGVHSPLEEIPSWLNQAVPDEPGLFDRAYVHAYRFAQDSNLHVVAMPEVWYRNSTAYDFLYSRNAAQISSIVRSALGRAALEEVLHQAVDVDEAFLGPVTTTEQIERQMRYGPDLQFQLRTTGVGATLNYYMGTFSVGTGYATEGGRMAPVRLSYPFLEEDMHGEVGVDSNGNAWIFMNARW